MHLSRAIPRDNALPFVLLDSAGKATRRVCCGAKRPGPRWLHGASGRGFELPKDSQS
jgi:hypothetical protein